MYVKQYEKKYATQIAELLNQYLPFQIETAETIDAANGIRFIYTNPTDEVIGYIAGYFIDSFEQDFPYFIEELADLKKRVHGLPTLYSSHFVVNPNYRKQGIGQQLVDAYLEASHHVAEKIIVVGWVQSDTNHWAAERQFVQRGFESVIYIPRYFEPYEVDCPSCNGLCYCDAHIFIK